MFCLLYQGRIERLAGRLEILFQGRQMLFEKIYKTHMRPYIEYGTQVMAPVSRHENWVVILRLEDI